MEEKMKPLIYEVENIIDREYLRASDKYGRVNHSDHESHSVILEEFDESEDERIRFIDAKDRWWANVKLGVLDGSKIGLLAEMQRRAMRQACECIQTAAMCMKAIVTTQKRNEVQNEKSDLFNAESTSEVRISDLEIRT